MAPQKVKKTKKLFKILAQPDLKKNNKKQNSLTDKCKIFSANKILSQNAFRHAISVLPSSSIKSVQGLEDMDGEVVRHARRIHLATRFQYRSLYVGAY